MPSNSQVIGQHNCSTRQQRGASLAVVIFILVVLASLGVVMVRVLSLGSASVVSEVVGTRAVLAARSGLELALTDLFPLNQSTATSCTVVNSNRSEVNFTGAGLTDCRAEVSCVELDAGDFIQYRLVSVGVCAVGNQEFSRRLLLEASDASL
ncbi:pilus assembly PilX family protein [Aliidiomarina indica]|uniref:pilus assembly PilX family protein n=1 Tax=Aliidiomarina indica TaxID=2749147 RepID=UPI0018902E7D|nr:type II secretory pathway component [Aliidiomarina indica]